MSISDKIDDDIRRNFSAADNGSLDRSLSLRDDLEGFDLDVIQLVMDLEDHLDVEITDEEAEELKTVGDVHALVERKVAERAPA